LSDGLDACIQPENTCFAGWSGRWSVISTNAVVSGGSLGGVE